MNHDYDDKCLGNETIMRQVKEFEVRFARLTRLTHNEVMFINSQGYHQKLLPDMCERKRNIARSITDRIEPIADFCICDQKLRKEFVLNTLMLLQMTLDQICEMNATQFKQIYETNVASCFNNNRKLLENCEKKSFDLYFWEKVPEAGVSVIQLLNGSVCKYVLFIKYLIMF